MDKLKMAHEWAMQAMIDKQKVFLDAEGLAWKAWEYADAMQAEAEKRKPSGLPEALKEEWQPDWSKAPDGYNYFCVGSYSGNGYFCHIEPIIYKDHHWFTGEDVIEVKNHGYQGNWKDSLRKRPQ